MEISVIYTGNDQVWNRHRIAPLISAWILNLQFLYNFDFVHFHTPYPITQELGWGA